MALKKISEVAKLLGDSVLHVTAYVNFRRLRVILSDEQDEESLVLFPDDYDDLKEFLAAKKVPAKKETARRVRSEVCRTLTNKAKYDVSEFTVACELGLSLPEVRDLIKRGILDGRMVSRYHCLQVTRWSLDRLKRIRGIGANQAS